MCNVLLTPRSKEDSTAVAAATQPPTAAAAPGSLFSAGLCVALRVPCRFVSDHPCCAFRTPLNMAARARAMDGSPDLKWRGARRMGGGDAWGTRRPLLTAGKGEAAAAGANAVPGLIMYTSADTKARKLLGRSGLKFGPRTNMAKKIPASVEAIHFLRFRSRKEDEPSFLPSPTGSELVLLTEAGI